VAGVGGGAVARPEVALGCSLTGSTTTDGRHGVPLLHCSYYRRTYTGAFIANVGVGSSLMPGPMVVVRVMVRM